MNGSQTGIGVAESAMRIENNAFAQSTLRDLEFIDLQLTHDLDEDRDPARQNRRTYSRSMVKVSAQIK